MIGNAVIWVTIMLLYKNKEFVVYIGIYIVRL